MYPSTSTRNINIIIIIINPNPAAAAYVTSGKTPTHLQRAAGENRRRHFFQTVGRQVQLSNGYRQRQAPGGRDRRWRQEFLHDRCRREGVPPQRQAVDGHARQLRRQRGKAVAVRLDRGHVLESGYISRKSLGGEGTRGRGDAG